MTAATWTEQDYNAGFLTPRWTGFPYLRASLAAAVVSINLCAGAVMVKLAGLSGFEPAAFHATDINIAPSRPTLLAVAGPKVAELSAAPVYQAVYQAALTPPQDDVLRLSADITGPDAYAIAEATAEAPVMDSIAEAAVPSETYTADVREPVEGEIPSRPIPYVQLAGNDAGGEDMADELNN